MFLKGDDSFSRGIKQAVNLLLKLCPKEPHPPHFNWVNPNSQVVNTRRERKGVGASECFLKKSWDLVVSECGWRGSWGHRLCMDSLFGGDTEGRPERTWPTFPLVEDSHWPCPAAGRMLLNLCIRGWSTGGGRDRVAHILNSRVRLLLTVPLCGAYSSYP